MLLSEESTAIMNATTTDSLVISNDRHSIDFNTMRMLVLGVHGVITVLGVLFNLVIITIYIRGKRSSMQDIKMLIINLAVFNLVYSITGPIPNGLDMVGASFPDSAVLCRMYRFLYVFSAYGSCLAILAIAVEHSIVIFFPVRVLQQKKRKRVMAVVLAVFVMFDLVVSFEYLFSPELKTYNGRRVCRSRTSLELKNYGAFVWWLAIKFCGSMILTTVLYTIIGIKMCMRKSMENLSESLQRKLGEINKTGKTLFVSAVFTVAAWLPYNIYSTVAMYNYKLIQLASWQVDYLDGITFALQLSACFIPPLVIFIMEKTFKKDFREMVTCRSSDKPEIDIDTKSVDVETAEQT